MESTLRSKAAAGRVISNEKAKVTVYDVASRSSVTYTSKDFEKVDLYHWQAWLVAGDKLIGTTRIGKAYKETGNSLLRVWEL
jgi:hypothetical protein